MIVRAMENSREGGYGVLPVEAVYREARKGLPEMVIMNKSCLAVSWEQIVIDRRKNQCKGPEVQVCLEHGKNSMVVNMTEIGAQG